MMIPSDIILHQKSKELELVFDGQAYLLPAEYLRVYSPSAEVKGHHPDEEKTEQGKKHVAITEIEAVGHYAIKLYFDDGHHTGIYTWDYLYELAREQKKYWQRYIARLEVIRGHRESA